MENTSSKIFHKDYQIVVPYLYNVRVDEIRELGVRSTGDAVMTAGGASRTVVRWATINDMVELQRRGATVTLVNDKDAVKIYDDIMLHLDTWKHIQENYLNIKLPPTADLLDLDRLASRLFKDVRLHRKVDKRYSGIMGILEQNRESAGLKELEGVGTVGEVTDRTEKHESRSDAFINRRVSGGWRRRGS